MSAITRGNIIETNGSVGTASATAIAAASMGQRQFLFIQNIHATNNLAYTLDGTAPGINTAGCLLFPGGSSTYDTFVPTGPVIVVGSAAATTYNIKTM